MTVFLDFRTQDRAGGLRVTPEVVRDTPGPRALDVQPWSAAALRHMLDGREAVFVTHGFNVSRREGVGALARFERELGLPPAYAFVGVLWPGDWWIPVINYPGQAYDAAACGRALADFVNRELRVARCSFVSHSLGARVVFEAALAVDCAVRDVCVMAAAVDDDALSSTQYAAVRGRAERVCVLASFGDRVLRLAYPVGDFVSDIAYDPDSPFRRALGYHGPRPSLPAPALHAQICDPHHGHGDYLPPADAAATPPEVARVERFVSEVLRRAPHAWP